MGYSVPAVYFLAEQLLVEEGLVQSFQQAYRRVVSIGQSQTDEEKQKYSSIKSNEKRSKSVGKLDRILVFMKDLGEQDIYIFSRLLYLDLIHDIKVLFDLILQNFSALLYLVDWLDSFIEVFKTEEDCVVWIFRSLAQFSPT